MNFEEFLKPDPTDPTAENTAAENAATEENLNENIDVQKAVVESLAADKAEMSESILGLKQEQEKLTQENATLKEQLAAQEKELQSLRTKLEEQAVELSKVSETLAKNSETALSNCVALLDRASELPDRFPGETREHVLEVIREARDRAEAEGRLRRGQILESVLLANESNGELKKKREELEKLFADNGNIVSGPVIEALTTMGLTHKNGEEYLLPSEIIKRSY